MGQLHSLGASSPQGALHEIPLTSQLIERPSIHVLRPDAQLQLHMEHKPPALVNEWYALEIHLASESDELSSGFIELQHPKGGQGDQVQFFTSDGSPLPAQVQIAPMQPNTVQVIQICTRSAFAVTKLFSVQVTYETPQGFTLHCSHELQLAYQQPVTTRVRFLSAVSSQMVRPVQIAQQPSPVAPLIPSTPVLVFVEIENSCDHALYVWDVVPHLIPALASSVMGSISESHSLGKPFCKGDCFTVCFKLTPNDSTAGALLGSIVVGLSRLSAMATQCEASFPLQAIIERPLPFSVRSCPLPALVCGEGAEMAYTILNHSQHPQEFRVSVASSTGSDSSNSFMVAGVTSRMVEILPGSEHVLSFNIIPTKTGNVRIPQLTIQATAVEVPDGCMCSVEQLVDLSLPGRRTCFVKPHQLES